MSIRDLTSQTSLPSSVRLMLPFCIAKQFVTSYRDYTGVTWVVDTFYVINCSAFKFWVNVTFLHCKAVVTSYQEKTSVTWVLDTVTAFLLFLSTKFKPEDKNAACINMCCTDVSVCFNLVS